PIFPSRPARPRWNWAAHSGQESPLRRKVIPPDPSTRSSSGRFISRATARHRPRPSRDDLIQKPFEKVRRAFVHDEGNAHQEGEREQELRQRPERLGHPDSREIAAHGQADNPRDHRPGADQGKEEIPPNAFEHRVPPFPLPYRDQPCLFLAAAVSPAGPAPPGPLQEGDGAVHPEYHWVTTAIGARVEGVLSLLCTKSR